MIRRWLPALALIVAGAGLPARIASAGPVEQRQAEAKRIAAERERLVQEAERLNERVNAANDELTRLNTAVSASIGAVEQQQAAVGHLRERLSAFAIASYMQSDGTDQLASVLSGVNDVGLRRGYAPIVLGDQADLLDQVRAATQDLDRTSKDLADRRDRQQKLLASVQANRADITRTQDKLAALAKNVDRELAAAVQAEQERQAAAAEAAAAPNNSARQRPPQTQRRAQVPGSWRRVRRLPRRPPAGVPAQPPPKDRTAPQTRRAHPRRRCRRSSRYESRRHRRRPPSRLVQAPRTGDVVKVSPLSGRNLVGAVRPG